MRKIYFISIISILFGSSCELINPSEDIPAYLYVTPFSFTAEVAKHGSASANITEAWLTVNGDFLGVYTLPALIPVLASGDANVRLEAGIHDNGIRSTPNVYPYYEAFTLDVELASNEIDTISPSTTYRDAVQFAFIEDFENGSNIFTRQLEGENGLTLTNDVIFEGAQSGMIKVTKDDPLVEIATIEAYPELADDSPLVYLEMNYKSEVSVVWGVIGFTTLAGEEIKIIEPGFRARENWNKIYFDLSLLVLAGNTVAHQIVLQADLSGSNQEDATIYLDNIKLVHF